MAKTLYERDMEDSLRQIAEVLGVNVSLTADVEDVIRDAKKAGQDAKRWRWWRNFWPALCRMEVARFVGLDLSRTHVQSPDDMDAVTDAARKEKP